MDVSLMTDFYIQLIVVVLIVATALCTAIWRLAKAGGHVDVGFHVSVGWGKK